MLALIVLRYKEPKLPRPYKVMNPLNLCKINQICVNSVSYRDPRDDGGDQPVPGDSPHSGQPPDRIPLLHPLHAGRGGALHSICLHGIRLQVHG